MRASLTSVAVAIAVLGVVTGCASPSDSVQATDPGPPAVPDGWNEVTSDAGDVRLTLPPDIPAMFTASGIMAWLPVIDGALQLEVHAVGPADVGPQPGSGEDIRLWLEGSGWVPRAGDMSRAAITSEAVTEIDLPSGNAIEVDVTVDPGQASAARVVVYAIETGDGIAIIRIVGNPDLMEERAGELRLVATLAEFGDFEAPERSAGAVEPVAAVGQLFAELQVDRPGCLQILFGRAGLERGRPVAQRDDLGAQLLVQ